MSIPKNLNIYPNPANDVVHIIAENTILKSATICDITGRVLFTKSRQEESLDISKFSKGLYLLKCEDKEGKVFVNKMMKEY